ncbi:YdeI/OmpD-associated family protein [Culicoidibacter larvae]|uniref:YdhG-like domain-containing protein n=1 Tax=Culicoidibacter larvae TaxID=2579976 RepID=A0A5R8Q833_9FIRM|nr:YdeI/OmpD-associated family protein [Culicoidibacter larvae]TLG71750.1 hypothetical protein FEZ08_10090 [Culicoidibacter larvae]
MAGLNPKVDVYMSKLKMWQDETEALRSVMLSTGLDEELKWGKPCYAHEGKNIALIQGFKSYFALLFMKGGLMIDPDNVLVNVGENSEAAKQMRFTDVDDILAKQDIIKKYVEQAVAVEVSGAKREAKAPQELVVPEELTAKFEQDPIFRTAFEALTPGRQKAYIMHFEQAKQSATRTARIEKYTHKILEGKGMMD